MKELSIEEKVVAYDNAIERAKNYYNTTDSVADSELIELIFPELKESEGKKIRNGLIGYFRAGKCENISSYHGISTNDILAWLEKQGEQKQEWSEEDEDNFKHLIDEIVCLGNGRNSANRLYYDKLIKFLDELKNRAQPREEWCDKDKRMLDRLIAYFEKRVAFTDDDNPRYANWLKSLRPQNHWKPSEEEMNALNDVISSRDIKYDVLSELWKDLRKLKEE